MERCLPDILVVAETKIDTSFNNPQFYMNGYYKPTRCDRTETGGGIIEYVRKGLIRKRLEDFELKRFESIASELFINRTKWFLISLYRSPQSRNIDLFFEELTQILNKATLRYENIIVMGDINIDKGYQGYTHLVQLLDIFNLTNIIKECTCFVNNKWSKIDVILTNRPRKFCNSKTFELGISDVHKLICTTMRQHVTRLKPKTIKYRSTKNFNLEQFRNMIEGKLNELSAYELYDCNCMYNMIVEATVISIDKFAPIKTKTIRGNNCRFMRKELSKAIMTRSRFKNCYNKNPTPDNRTRFKRQRNYCTKLKNKYKKEEFEKASENFKKGTKPFYKIIKPFMSNKGEIDNTDITLAENGYMITDTNEVVNVFNNYYINIVEFTSGKVPSNIAKTMPNSALPDDLIDKIKIEYQDHPSIKAIKDNIITKEPFHFREVTEEEVYKLLITIDHTKSTGEDNIPAKFVKSAADLLTRPFTKVINKSINGSCFPDKAKVASVLPIFKSLERILKNNYRPVSILSTFSKILERVIKSQIVPYMDCHLSEFVSAYRKNYSSEHVLIRLLEEWRAKLDQNFIVGAVLMDLSKAFDCIPHDLLIAKLHSYGLSNEALRYIYSYLKGRKQRVKLGDIESDLLDLLSGVPQGSILGPILFNIFINDIFLFIKTANLHGFADDHTLSASEHSMERLIEILSHESEIAIEWLTKNEMIANPSKFQAIILKKSKESTESCIKIKDIEIKTKTEVKLLGITIDDKLNFDKHIGNICSRAGGQLNSLYRLSKFMSPITIRAAINCFVLSNFNYCSLAWLFTTAKSKRKIEKIHERALKLSSNDVTNSYEEMLQKLGKCTMEQDRLKKLCIEIYKTLHDLNAPYMKSLFYKSLNRTSKRLKHNINVAKHNQANFGTKSLRVLGPKLWNNLPENIKNADSLATFKKFMKSFQGLSSI